MAGFRDREQQYFPLQDSEAVIRLFKYQLENTDDPNLALLSIIVGCIENTLTVNRAFPQDVDSSKSLEPIFPVIEIVTVEALYSKFVSQIKGAVDLTRYKSGYATRELVKRVSDVIWSNLTRSYYKDKAHLQSLYSYLTGNKLDCFGVAFGVVAACQVLGFNDVHLALSEDHAWVIFGKNGEDTAEVTWHGKGNEDKRGQPVSCGVDERRWLYLNSYPVKCTRYMEVASMVSGINPSINASMDSVEMASLQQELLWLLYDKNHLKLYPMALGNLGDLEEIIATPGRPPPATLFKEAVDTAKAVYSNRHVYPYTYFGSYLYRKGLYRDALKFWAEASSVISGYNYNREDEEIYKEFLEIANELIPHVVKLMSNDGVQFKPCLERVPFLQDPECYALLLRFYDGICEWEEGSSTPVLHIGWAKQFAYSLSKFDPKVRSRIVIECEGGVEEDSDSETEEDEPVQKLTNGKNGKKHGLDHTDGNGLNGGGDDDHINPTIQELESKVGTESQNEARNPNIVALAQACGESILNPEYLLGSGEPFTSVPKTVAVDISELLSSKANGSPFPGMTMDSMLKADSPADMALCRHSLGQSDFVEIDISKLEIQKVVFKSQKMKGLRKLLTSSAKFNSSAIKLQLTAQSQVSVKHSIHSKRSSESYDYAGIRKRMRRESKD
ncbi:menin-like [Lineus longissimus]|uniref:menin-like n=1 Tax=Lineus longissimus TaxID=88925 RepID=UPI002B4D7E5B